MSDKDFKVFKNYKRFSLSFSLFSFSSLGKAYIGMIGAAWFLIVEKLIPLFYFYLDELFF